MKIHHTIPIVCIVGYSGSGKTTLLEKLIPILRKRGYKVGTVKHDVHGFEMDKPGKDSWRHKQAGAQATIISSSSKIGMVMDVDHDYTLDQLKQFFPGVDIILTEGYKREKKPKVEIYHDTSGEDPLCKSDPNLVAMVTEANVDLEVPRFHPDDVEGLAEFLIDRFLREDYLTKEKTSVA